VGRVLLYEVVPETIPFKLVNSVMDKAALDRLIAYAYRFCGDKDTVLLADHLRTIGYEYATRAGISISLSDMIIPENKWDILKVASENALEIDRQRNEGAITDGERYNKVVDVWATATEDVAAAMMRGIAEQEIVSPEGETRTVPSFNSVFIMADSGARGSAQQMRQLSGMRGLMAKPSGEIIETPITANFREGLTVLQYFISTHGARKGLADTALKTANSGYLTRRLVDVAQDAIVTEHDCGTLDGIDIGALVDGGEIIESLGERIVGRVSLEPIINPHTDEMIVGYNEEIDELFADKIVDSGLESVRIRSVLTCQARRGICQLCYGRDLSRHRMVNLGEAAGVIAAQSIGEPGTQLTMRTFHFGGVGTLELQESSLETRSGGIVEYENLKGAERANGQIVVMNRNSELVVRDQEGRQKERYSLVYGSNLSFKAGEKIEPGATLAEWDPFSNPILTGHAGTVGFADIVEGVNMEESVDKVTYLSKMTIKESSDLDIKPRIVIRDKASNKLLSSYTLPVSAVINVNPDTPCEVGDILAKMPRESQKNKDITGGLPRVAELFEARKPKEMSIVTEVDGVVSYGKDTKGKTKLIVTPEFGDPVEYLIPKNKQVSVQDGDNVRAGDPLMEGSVNPHDILRIKGRKELSKHMVDEVQQVYRLQGVKIHDKHIEVIVRQMLRRVRIVDVGDTGLLIDETITRPEFAKVNQETAEEGGMPAVAEDLLLGITKASISTDSFVAAASFQETTKVLTNAAVHGRIDSLSGLKENVIMGRLIPAGTGLGAYRFLDLVLEPEAAEEEFVEALNIE
jgi:DNA-directed RNA polymerase subunit beta'